MSRTIEQWVAMADEAIEGISRVVPVNPSSRLYAYRRALESMRCGITPQTPKDAKKFWRALIEVSELRLIARTFGNKRAPQAVKQLLTSIVRGQDTPDDEANQLSRNNQFHLYIASLLCSAGMQVKFAEPDLQVVVSGISVGIAAKRISSAKSFHKRISEGNDQLDRSKTPGFVWIEISQVLHPQSGLLQFDTDKDVERHHGAASSLGDQLTNEIKRVMPPNFALLGVLCSWVFPLMLANSDASESVEFLIGINLAEEGTPRHLLAQQVADTVRKGLRAAGRVSA